MTDAFQQIEEGLLDALRIARGEARPARIYRPKMKTPNIGLML